MFNSVTTGKKYNNEDFTKIFSMTILEYKYL